MAADLEAVARDEVEAGPCDQLSENRMPAPHLTLLAADWKKNTTLECHYKQP